MAQVYHQFTPSGAEGADPTKVNKSNWMAAHVVENDTTVLADLSGLTDGVTTTFFTPDFFIEASTRVFLNGMLQRVIFDYDEAATLDSVVFVVAPVDGDELQIEYLAQED